MLVLIGFLGFYATAYAGIFSLVSEIFGSPVKAYNQTQAENPKNSQNIELLAAALNTDPNPSKGSSDISIVDRAALLASIGPAGPLASIVVKVPQSDQISLYVVREGDTLSQIAEMFNVSANTIKWANDLPSASLIKPGQTLVILPISGVRHTVKSGDTLESVAKKYGGAVEEISLFNSLTVDASLRVGEEIVIPDGEIVNAVISAPVSRAAVSSRQGNTNISYSSDMFMRPIDGGVRTQGIHGYNAVDLAVAAGTPVYAAAAGDVIISKDAGWNGGYGNYVVIKHGNGVQTLYAHNSSNTVSSRQSVIKGQVIGYVGQTGKATGPHVHFEVRGAKNPF
jgi:murein DD-endopeptidase MepM/ murein hydrolase activator NlpD